MGARIERPPLLLTKLSCGTPPLVVPVGRTQKAGFKSTQIEGSGSVLENLCQEIFDRLSSYDKLPVSMRAIANIIYTEVEAKFANCGQDVLVTVLFLRMMCPAIVSPLVFGLTDTNPHPLHARSLILVSKLIQASSCPPFVSRPRGGAALAGGWPGHGHGRSPSYHIQLD